MTLLNVINFYISANVLLILAATALWGVRTISARLTLPVAYRHQLRFGRIIVGAAVLLPLLTLLPGQKSMLPHTAQVWSAPSMQTQAPELSQPPLAITFAADSTPVPLAAAGWAALLSLLGGTGLLLLRLSMDARKTWRIVRQAHALRQHGRVKILLSDSIPVPFSWWLPARCFIVVPAALALRFGDMRMVIRHEGQHHRQLDTRLVYLQQLLRALFFWNPAAHLLARSLSELQEFACDEALVAQPDIDAHDYCRCLLDVAETASLPRAALLQVGMLDHAAGAVLKRRIEAMLHCPASSLRPSRMVIACAMVTALMALAACTVSSAVRDHRITHAEAERMAIVARASSTIPIDVNDRVLEQLNLLLATPDGRAFLKAGLQRMRQHEAFMAAQLQQRGLPQELLAVPLVESGYRNLPPDGDARRGAGLWMFIAPTARNYGLTVQTDRDDRLDIAAETRAALDMFADLHARFGDWRLALLAYNAGNGKVEEGLTATGARDAWQLVEKGYHARPFYGDAAYLPRVIATILIMKNPAVLGGA